MSSSGDVSLSDSDPGTTDTERDDTRTLLKTRSALYTAYSRIEELEESLTGKQLALDKVISENDQLQRKLQESKLTDMDSALRKREDLIVQLSSALQTVTSQPPSDVIAVELTQEVQNLKAQLAGKLLEAQSEKYKSTTQTLQEAKAEIAVLQRNLKERDSDRKVTGSPGANQESPLQQSSTVSDEIISQLQQELQEAKANVSSLEAKSREPGTGSEEGTNQIQIQLDALQEVLERKDNEIVELQSCVSRSESDCDKLRLCVKQLETRLTEADDVKEKNEALKTDVENVNEMNLKEIERLRKNNAALEESVKTLNENTKEFDLLKTENQKLTLKVSDLEENMKETEELKVKVEILEEKVKLTEEMSAGESGELDLLKADYELLTDTLNLKNERIRELEVEVVEGKHEIEIDLLRGDNERLSEEVENLEEKLEICEKNIAEKGRRLESFSMKRDELLNSLGEKDTKIFMFETSIAELQREKEQQALELDQLNEDLENALSKCKRTDDLEVQLETLVSQLNGLQQECQCYRIQNDELKNRINVQQDLYLRQQYQIEVAGSEKEQLQKENLKLGSEREELVQEIQRLKSARTEKSAENDEMEKTAMQEPVSNVKNLESEIHCLKEENLSFKVKVQSLEEQILGLQKDLENSQEEKSLEIDKIQDMYKQELLDKDDVIKTLQNENDIYKEKLGKLSTPPEEWETGNDGDESITEFMMECVVEDLLCQSEVMAEKEAESLKAFTAEDDRKRNEHVRDEIVQEEFISASPVNVSLSSVGTGESDEVDHQDGTASKQHIACNISEYEEDIPKLSETTHTDEAQSHQSVLLEIESIGEQNSQEECDVRSVLNLDSDVSLDSANFLKILRTLQNQKCLLVEKLEQTEAERDKLLQRIQPTGDISEDSLDLNDSIDEDNFEESHAESGSKEIQGFTDIKEVEDMLYVETEMTDFDPNQRDITLLPDSVKSTATVVKSAATVERHSNQGTVQNLDPADGEKLAADGEKSAAGDIQLATEDIKVSPCMLSSSGAASSVLVDELTNSVPSVENVSVHTKPVVSVETASDEVYKNFTTDGETEDLTVNVQGCNDPETLKDPKTDDLSVKLEGELSVLVLANETLQKNLELVMEELDGKSRECDDIQSKFKHVSNQFDVFKASFSDVTIKNENLEYDNEELNEKLQNLQKELTDVKHDYLNLQDHYDMVGDENHTLRNEHDQLTQKYEAVVSENVSLLQSLSDSEVNGSKVLKESEEIVKKLKDAEVENSQLNQELSQLKVQNSLLEAEIDELHKKLDKLNSDCDSLLVEKSEFTENHRKLVNEMKIIEKEKLEGLKNFQNLQQKYQEEKQRQEDLRTGKIAELESCIDELGGQNRILTFNNQNAETKIVKLMEKADEDRKRQEEEIFKKNEEILKINEEQRSLQSCVKDKDSELHQIRGILQDTEKRNCQLNKDLENLKIKTEELKNQIVLLEEKLRSRDKDVEAVQKQFEDLTGVMKSVRSENEELKRERVELVEKCAVEQKEREIAARDSQNLVEILKEKESLLEEMTLDCDTVRREVCEQKEEMRKISEDRVYLKSALEEQVQKKEIEMRNLTALHENKLEMECGLKNSEIERLTLKLNEAQCYSEEQREKYEMEFLQKKEEIQRIHKDFKEKAARGELHVEELQHTISELEIKIENVRSEHKEMKTTEDREICDLVQKVRNQETQNKALQEEVSSLEEINSEMVRKVKELDQECQRLKTELRREVESRVREKHLQIEQLKGDIGELRGSIGTDQPQQELEETSVLASLGKLETALSKITANMTVPTELSERELVVSEVPLEEHTTGDTCRQTVDKEDGCEQTGVSVVVENLELKKTVETLKVKVQELEKDKNYFRSCLKVAVKGTSKEEEENLEAVMEENSHLMEENQALTEELQKLRNGAETLDKDKTGTKDKLQEKVNVLSSENFKLRQYFSDLQEEVNRGQNQIVQVTSLFQQSVLANEGLKNEIMSLKDELESIAVSRESVDEALLNVEQKISLKERQLHISTQESGDDKESVDTLSSMENKISQPEEEDESSENCNTLGQSGEIDKLSETLVSLTISNSVNIVLKEETEKLHCHLVEKEKDLEELSRRCQESEDEKIVAQKRIEMLEEELENAQKIASLCEMSQNEQKHHIHELEENLKVIATENLEMRNERETIIQEVKVHRDITTEMRDSVERSRHDVCDIRKEQSEFKLKMDEIIVEKDRLSRDLAKRVSENKELRSKVAALCDENDQLKQSLEKFEEVKAERGKLISIQEKLLEDLTEMEGRYETVHNLMEETKQECNNEMEKLRQQLGSVNRDVGSLKLSIDVLQSELQSAQEQKEHLITSLEEKNDLLVFTEKERQKEVNDKFNKELQNQRKAGGGSDSGVFQRLDSEEPRESINQQSKNDHSTGRDFVVEQGFGSDSYNLHNETIAEEQKGIQNFETEGTLSPSYARNDSGGGNGDELETVAQQQRGNEEEVLSERFVVEELDAAITAVGVETERAGELQTLSETGPEERGEMETEDAKEEREKIREELKEEYEQRIEGVKYEMEERLEMSLKEREFELLGKFDMEKKELIKQMEHAVSQKIKSVKAEKHKEFVEAMQRVRKDQGRKLRAEVEKQKTRIREKFQKPLKEICEERDRLLSEIRQLKRETRQTPAGDDSVFTEQDEILVQTPAYHSSMFIFEEVALQSSFDLDFDLDPGQEWPCRKSECQKLHQSFKDLLDRTETCSFSAPGSGRSDGTGGGVCVEQGFKPEVIETIASSGTEGFSDQTLSTRLDGFRSGKFEVVKKRSITQQGIESSGSGNAIEESQCEIKQGFQPELDEEIKSSGLGIARKESQSEIKQGFQPELDQEIESSGLGIGRKESQSEIMQGFQPELGQEIENKSLVNPREEVQSEIKQGFQPEFGHELEGTFFSQFNDNGEVEQGFNPEDAEYFKDIHDEDLQASRLSLNLEPSWVERNVHRSFSEEPPQFSPEVRKVNVFPSSAPVHHFLTETSEGFIPTKVPLEQDPPINQDFVECVAAELSEIDRVQLEKLVKAKESEVLFLENKIKLLMVEFSKEKSELLEKCQTLNTQMENEILLRQGLEQELNSLVEDISSAGPKIQSRQKSFSTSSEYEEDDVDGLEKRKDDSISISANELMENKIKGLNFLYEKEKQLREAVELECKTEKLYRKDLEQELKSAREGTKSLLSASLSGRNSNKKPFTQRQFSYEAEDVGQRSGDTWMALKLFSNQHYKEMENRLNQLEFQNTFLTEKIRIVESLNNGERKALVEKIRKLESELSELRQGSVFLVEEEEEVVVEGDMDGSYSVPHFLAREGARLTIEMDTEKSPLVADMDEQHVVDEEKEKAGEKMEMSSSVDVKDQSVAEDTEKIADDIADDLKERKQASETEGEMIGNVGNQSKMEELEASICKLTETLSSCQEEMDVLRRDNLSLQLEMKGKDDFIEHVESRTKDLISQLNTEVEENERNKQKVQEISDQCESKEKDLKELMEKAGALRDSLAEERLVCETLQSEIKELQEKLSADVNMKDEDCQVDSSMFNDDGVSVEMKLGRMDCDRDACSRGTSVDNQTLHTATQTNEDLGRGQKESEMKDMGTDPGTVEVITSDQEAQTIHVQFMYEYKQTQTESEEHDHNFEVSLEEMESLKASLQEKEVCIKKLEEELDQIDSSEVEGSQDFQDYRIRMEKTLKEKETYIRKLEEHLLGRQTPERNLKALGQKLHVESPPQVDNERGNKEGDDGSTPRGKTEKRDLVVDMRGDKMEVKGKIDPLLPWSSPLDDELELPSNYSGKSISPLEISTTVTENFPESADLLSPSGSSVYSGSAVSTFSGGSWDCNGDRVVSGLGPKEDGHKALENKHFELIDEISDLRKDLKETKSIYTQENALLQEALEREKWMSSNLKSKLGMTNTVVNFDLSAELVSLRQKVSMLQETNKMLQMENDKWLKRVQEQERIVIELRGQLGSTEGSTEKDELFTQQVALLQLQRQELIEKLKERDLENNKLSGSLGDRMILEENLRREKDLLKVKLSERESIENELHEKKMELQRQIGYQRKLEDIIYHKNLIEKELMRQKRLLEIDFLEIEAKLQEKEELLEIQRNQLLRELKMKDQILALGSDDLSEATSTRSDEVSRGQSPSVSETSSRSGRHSMGQNFLRSGEKEVGRVQVMLTDAEKEHINAIEFLKGKLKAGSGQKIGNDKSMLRSWHRNSSGSLRTGLERMLYERSVSSTGVVPSQRSESVETLQRRDTDPALQSHQQCTSVSPSSDTDPALQSHQQWTSASPSSDTDPALQSHQQWTSASPSSDKQNKTQGSALSNDSKLSVKSQQGDTLPSLDSQQKNKTLGRTNSF
ncbi:centromere protein F-like isoform X2 [Ostrea edulis]|uniref:centromere protein F-like isoform X2 n=1 Tax=Ostrea edulis TaxID=37623 RepID=UPI0024AFAF8D|nr:centromere protein F-like isoform X2 [Ostrea edulis]